jgi:SAM-dependent methyltransferase
LETEDREYAERLVGLQTARWKRMLRVQAPYRWNLRRLHLGFVLDIGCGLGRNLMHLDGRGVGVDHNPDLVELARARGLEVYTPEQFRESRSDRPVEFDSLLLAHVAEHLGLEGAATLLREYLPFLRDGGRVVVITPQEWAFRRDPTHVEFFDFERLSRLERELGLVPVRQFSFPLPRTRLLGRLFPQLEFVSISKAPQRDSSAECAGRES